jgi:hypothetical protein
MKNQGRWLLLGFSLFILGFTGIILQMIGVHWAFLAWLEIGGRLFSFVFKIIMVLAGVLTIVFARTDWARERRESE